MNDGRTMDTPSLTNDQVNTCLTAYRQGQTEALDELVMLSRRPLYAYALRLTANPHAAEELFQDTWLKAIRQLDSFRGGRFLSWLFRIAHNRHIDNLRRHRETVSLQAASPGTGASLEDVLPDGSSDPGETAAATDGMARIHRAVDALPPPQREVFLMRTEADMTFREIAAVLDISINTALARMQYALRKLRHHLTQPPEEQP